MLAAITGGTGFIGMKLASAILAEGNKVRILTRDEDGQKPRLPGAQYVMGDLASSSALGDFVEGADVLFHCAGEITRPSLMEAVHVDGTARLIDAAAGKVRRWVQLSSTGAYGTRRAGVVTDDDDVRPNGAYEITKVASDHLVATAGDQGAFSYSIVRPTIVFGAGMPNQSMFAMLRMIDKGIFFFIGRPGASANYVHVDNVVHALSLCGQAEASGKTYIVSEYCTMEAMVMWMATVLGTRPPRLRLPEAPVRLAAEMLQVIPHWPLKVSRVDALTSFARYSTARIEQELGYKTVTTTERGVADLVRYYRANNT
ncbi:NAD-dependent epimerase/dehydratase family protein [Rhizobium sp. CECT 9324]|uniref:NAD-dependent epimerase/dehydratase family protein n=1 Tax=Rhizobium sp. CECT 9324 TaxID=2845820 RepID=UPI001E5F1C8D|nr:NAD-dependent epimerase/dehydratase family protein [Rhizobium sp. CECT 9324]CAH0343193.1 3 beta-hydroxysteroid dehydrogenase/Delta 5-->4-isomerase [Rhizobium sp. CECT 9324]